jgi:hypothetical protein
LKVLLCDIKDISDADIQQMYKVYELTYSNTNFQTFNKDLTEKTQAILLYSQNKIIGFSLLLVYESLFQGQKLQVIYSGDTVIAKEYWGSLHLSHAWLRYAGQIKIAKPQTPLYWLLLSKGNRTYRYLTLYFKKYYPSPNTKNSKLKAIAEHLGQEKFADYYQAGIVRFPETTVSLRDSVDNTNKRIKFSQDIQSFVKLNPDYHKGDELLCLAEISCRNLIPRTHKFFGGVN